MLEDIVDSLCVLSLLLLMHVPASGGGVDSPFMVALSSRSGCRDANPTLLVLTESTRSRIDVDVLKLGCAQWYLREPSLRHQLQNV